MAENSKALEEAVKEVLGDMPKLRGYTLKELKEKNSRPWPTQRWHLERAEEFPRYSNEEIGSFSKKIEALMPKKQKYRVGEPEKPRIKPINERILETLIKKGPLSLDALVEKFQEYDYCMNNLMTIQIKSGHVREVRENNNVLYEITGKGQEYIKYGFGKKFLPLNKK